MREKVKAELRPLMLQSLRLADVTEAELTDDTRLLGGDLEIDSIDILQLIVTIEKHFGIQLVSGQFDRTIWETIDTLAAAIETRLIAKSAGTPQTP